MTGVQRLQVATLPIAISMPDIFVARTRLPGVGAGRKGIKYGELRHIYAGYALTLADQSG
jgi:hypothetical protein